MKHGFVLEDAFLLGRVLISDPNTVKSINGKWQGPNQVAWTCTNSIQNFIELVGPPFSSAFQAFFGGLVALRLEMALDTQEKLGRRNKLVLLVKRDIRET